MEVRVRDGITKTLAGCAGGARAPYALPDGLEANVCRWINGSMICPYARLNTPPATLRPLTESIMWHSSLRTLVEMLQRCARLSIHIFVMYVKWAAQSWTCFCRLHHNGMLSACECETERRGAGRRTRGRSSRLAPSPRPGM